MRVLPSAMGATVIRPPIQHSFKLYRVAETEADETETPRVCTRSYSAAAQLTYAANKGNDSQRRLMTEK
jgi:hypothetical protein